MEVLVWPGVVVILGIVAMCIFRRAIEGLINRTTKVDRGGITAASQQVATSETPQAKALTSKQLMEVNYTEVIRIQESAIRDQLAKIHFESEAEREALLLRVLAKCQINAVFDRINSLIFGTQLDILIAANASASGIPEDAIKQRFSEAKALDPAFHEPTTYDSYLGFLLNAGLLSREGDRLKVTAFGKEFMKYLVDKGLTYVRRG